MTNPIFRTGVYSGRLTTQSDTISIFDTAQGQDCTFAFDLIEAASGMKVRTLTPYADTTPNLSHDTTASIKRQLSLALSPADTAAIDPIAHRIRPYLVDVTGRRWPLGRYMFSDFSRKVTTAGRLAAPILMDEEFIIDQPLVAAFPPGAALTAVANLITVLMANYPTVDYTVDASPFTTPNTWSFGTSGLTILSDLALQGAYFAPWMGNDAQLHVIQSFDPATKIVDIDWDRYVHVYADSISETDDLLDSPNQFIVVSNNPDAASGAPIVGSYNIPTTAPNSITNRGFVIPAIFQLQVISPAQAAAVATTIGLTATVFERVTLSTYPDPRHDSYNVIRWNGANWLELGWSMDLIAGGTMTHEIRKAYS